MKFRTFQALMAYILAVVSYHIAFKYPDFGFMIIPALMGICLLGNLPSNRWAFYGGMALGLSIAGPQHFFFFNIFGYFAVLLWLILGFWFGIFLLILHNMRRLLNPNLVILLTPIVWIGVEYFRCELNFLKFTWITPGESFWKAPGLLRVSFMGYYGLDFIAVACASLIVSGKRGFALSGVVMLLAFTLATQIPAKPALLPDKFINVAGLQVEGKNAPAIAAYLEILAAQYPDAQLWVLNEYAFFDQVPPVVIDVVKKHGIYLVAGGKDKLPDGKFFNTAFVIDPSGDVVFKQVKSVPVQFMDDGIPAKTRQVWNSPWGKIGICVCYDLCYRRVMDDYVNQGAQALIIPTMDVDTWGYYERTHLHGPFQVIRSAEYGIATFGVWSSGVSMLTDPNGKVIAKAGYPGIGQSLHGKLYLKNPASPPVDSSLALIASFGVGLLCVVLFYLSRNSRRCIFPPPPEGGCRSASVSADPQIPLAMLSHIPALRRPRRGSARTPPKR
jgi:apolipoprotein N-acyltransferase